MQKYAHIFLDTCVIQSANEEQINALKFYLDITWKVAYASIISLKELKHNRREDVKEEVKQFKNYHSKLKPKDKENKIAEIDNEYLDKVIEDYVNYKTDQISFIKWISPKRNVLGLWWDMYEKWIYRSIQKIAPCHNKEEFRDTMIWLTYLEQAQKKWNVFFLSTNTLDFCKDKNSIELHPSLEKDLQENDIDIETVIIKKPDENPLEEFLQKWDYEDIPKLTPQVITEEVLLPNEAMEYLDSYKAKGIEDLRKFIKEDTVYEITNIEKVEWPNLKDVPFISVNKKEENWDYVYYFAMRFVFRLNILTSLSHFDNIEGEELLMWEIAYSQSEEKFTIREYESLISDVSKIDLSNEEEIYD